MLLNPAVAKLALTYVREYKEPQEYPDGYCGHGVYVGSWAGPDHMCIHCESGVDPSPYAAALARAKEEVARENAIYQAAKLLSREGLIKDAERIMLIGLAFKGRFN